jgi:hypothetical protein
MNIEVKRIIGSGKASRRGAENAEFKRIMGSG